MLCVFTACCALTACIGVQGAAAPSAEDIDRICNQPGGGRLPRELFAEAPAPVVDAAAASAAQNLSTVEAHRLLAINPQEQLYRATVPGFCCPKGQGLMSVVQICVNELGTVSSVRVLRSSKPILDEQLPDVVGRWKFHPYLHDGMPSAFCYKLHYRVM